MPSPDSWDVGGGGGEGRVRPRDGPVGPEAGLVVCNVRNVYCKKNKIHSNDK